MFVVIIPAYKPDGTLTELIEKLESFDVEKIVVDDGSGSEYEDVFREGRPRPCGFAGGCGIYAGWALWGPRAMPR